MYKTPDFDKACRQCNLGCGTTSVSGQSEVAFSKVKLIVISDYPGSREIESGLSLADNKKKIAIPDSGKSPVGAGEFLRYCLRSLKFPFPEDIERYTYFTNAVKCSPQNKKVTLSVEDKNVKICKDTWLLSELEMFNPRVPIWLCGGKAVKAVLGLKEGLFNNRNKVNWYGEHPVIVSTNPVDWETYNMRYVEDVEVAREHVVKLIERGWLAKFKKNMEAVTGSKIWKALPGSPSYFLKQDLILIKQQVIKYHNESTRGREVSQ